MRSHLRQQCLAARRALSEHERLEKSQAITEALWPMVQGADCIASYLAVDDEVSLAALHARCWDANISLCVPRIVNREQFVWVALTGPTDLISGAFGILTSQHPRTVAWDCIDAVLVPMVGFRATGERLGMGGGYYDRALSDSCARRAQWLGLAFDCQEHARIEQADWDVSMPVIVTETRTLVNPSWHCVPRSQPSKYHSTKTTNEQG